MLKGAHITVKEANMKKAFSAIILAAVVFLYVPGFGPTFALGAKFPEKAITIICPWGTGGATDISARVLAKHLARSWGVPVNVINKPGGNTVIGTVELNNARPDGYTVMMDNNASALLPMVEENLPFKILDRTWMNEISYTPYLLVVAANSKFKNFPDIIAAVRSDPTRFRLPSLGGAGLQDYFARQFVHAAGVDFKKVSLVMGKGGNDIMVFTAQGSVDIGFGGATAAKSFLDAKTLRPVAVSGSGGKRLDWLPNVPTFEEIGYPQINTLYWVGLSGPPGMTKEIVAVWNDKIKKMLAEDKDFRDELEKVGMTPRWHNQQEVIEVVKKDMETARILWGQK
jgi:tripartite-type tricarboxylate transporter receptor subunit TctC